MSVWGAVIPAVISAGSAWYQSRAAKDAAREQTDAADRAADLTAQTNREALDLQRNIYAQNREDLAPWRDAGGNALARLMGQWGENYQQSPSYNWRLSEGLRAVDAGMSARGLRNSTARDRAAGRFADGLASQDYEQWWNRGAALAGIGQSATGQGVAAGANFANNASQTMVNGANTLAGIYGQAGNANAAGSIGASNAWAGALQNIGDIAARYYRS